MRIYTLLLLLLFSAACDEIDKLTQFNMDYNSTVTIPSSTGINLPFDVMSPDVETNSESTFAVNDTRKDMIEEIKLTTLNLTIESPTESDFSFLESISVYIAAEGLEETKIAYLDEVPEDVGAAISLDVSDEDLKEYIKKDNFELRVNTVTDEFISSDHDINIYSAFFIDAKVLGQ
ncbi:hypothetical protein [Chondrinema litorale]|uniref:hypothetical protein n=1 Tax=Chondrinema litorale TaxID=2994555 RepID=UPI00254399BC|nr:hypothetical protein [Chondrinema litorale]UZR97925.1 hypothetical protein OQ292_29360 [Chondrinema litorale]